MKKVIFGLMTAAMVINAAPSFAWNASHCNTAVGETRAQKGKLLKECVGKFSKEKYMALALNYSIANGAHKEDRKIPDRVREVILNADKAINDPTIKWVARTDQKHIDNAKIAASVIGAVPAAYFVPLVFSAAGGATIWTYVLALIA